MLEAAQRKVAGEEAVVSGPSEQPRGKVIDLMSALKASLEKRGKSEEAEEAKPSAEEVEEPKEAAVASSRSRRPQHGRGSLARERQNPQAQVSSPFRHFRQLCRIPIFA